MKAYLSGTRLVAKLQMLRSGKKTKSFLVVEGITDYRLYSKMVDPERCMVVIGESKQNVMEAVSTCLSQGLEGIVGIVDADFKHMEQQIVSTPGILMTDGHDLESMMLSSKAYDRVLLEYSDTNKLARYEGHQQKRLRQILCENVGIIGYLRKLSLEEHFDFNFSELEFEAFTDLQTLKIHVDELIRYIIYRSKRSGQKNPQQVAEKLKGLMAEEEDLWQVCCGHDLMTLMAMGLSQIFGNYNAKKMMGGQLEGSFRLAYQESDFKETQLCKQLKRWQQQHPPYIFLNSNF